MFSRSSCYQGVVFEEQVFDLCLGNGSVRRGTLFAEKAFLSFVLIFSSSVEVWRLGEQGLRSQSLD